MGVHAAHVRQQHVVMRLASCSCRERFRNGHPQLCLPSSAAPPTLHALHTPHGTPLSLSCGGLTGLLLGRVSHSNLSHCALPKPNETCSRAIWRPSSSVAFSCNSSLEALQTVNKAMDSCPRLAASDSRFTSSLPASTADHDQSGESICYFNGCSKS